MGISWGRSSSSISATLNWVVHGVAHLAPQGPATLAQPGVDFDEGAEALLGRVDPDSAAACVHMAAKRLLTVRPLPFFTLSTAVFMLS